MPNGFEWVVIVVMILGRVVPVIAIVLLIIVLWRHLRKNKREEETGEAAPVVPIEAPSNTPGVIGHAAASNDSAGPRTPLTSERAEAIERTLLEHGLTERERVIVMGIYAGKTHAALAEELSCRAPPWGRTANAPMKSWALPIRMRWYPILTALPRETLIIALGRYDSNSPQKIDSPIMYRMAGKYTGIPTYGSMIPLPDAARRHFAESGLFWRKAPCARSGSLKSAFS